MALPKLRLLGQEGGLEMEVGKSGGTFYAGLGEPSQYRSHFSPSLTGSVEIASTLYFSAFGGAGKTVDTPHCVEHFLRDYQVPRLTGLEETQKRNGPQEQVFLEGESRQF